MVEIVIHQLQDSLKNMKFVISLVLIIILFIVNALFFSAFYEEKQHEYASFRLENLKNISDESENLNKLVFAKHSVQKEPSISDFISGSKQNTFPDVWEIDTKTISFPSKSGYKYSSNSILIDYLFILTVIGSFLIFLLTYDAISGEREKGTLKLVFSNSINNMSFILGKLCGVVLSVILGVFLGIVLNILIILLLGTIPITTDFLGEIAIFFVLYVVFVFLLSAIGLFVSFISKNSLQSLIILTIIWIVFSLVIPTVSRISVSVINKGQTLTEFEYQYKTADMKLAELLTKHDGATRGINEGRIDNYKKERGEALARAELAEYKQSIQDNYLDQKIRQAKLYNRFRNISPIYLFNTIIEDLFNSGIQRDINLMTQAKEFQQTLISFYKDSDAKDPTSPHVYFIANYLSNHPVSTDQIPVFKEKSANYKDVLKNSLSGLVILLVELLLLVTFLYLLFNKKQIT